MSASLTSRCVTARNTPGAEGFTSTCPRARRAQEAHRVLDAEHHHVGLGGRIDREAELLEPGGQPARVRVVVGESLDVMLERVEARRGEDAGLAHAAAQHLARAVHAPDHLVRAAHERADRRAEALGEAEGHRVEGLGPDRRGGSGRDHGVPQARAVEVQGEPVLLGHLRHVLQLVEREDAAAGAVVGVLDRDDRVGAKWTSSGEIAARTSAPSKQPPRPSGLHLHAPERGGRAGLVEQDVRVLAGEQHVAGLRERAQRGLVAHGAGGDEERRLLAELLGRAAPAAG